MSLNPENRNDWLAKQIPGTDLDQPEYPEIDRANKCLSYWMAGYDELEISALLDLSEIDVTRDLAYLRTKMNPRQQIAMNNDRQRILIQKQEAANYSAMLKGGLTKGVDAWLAAGLSPVPVMKEYRQAVGLEEKPGGVNISVTKQSATFMGNPPGHIPSANFGGGGKVKSFEDLVRMIIDADPSCGLQPIVDVDAQETPLENAALNSADEPDSPAEESTQDVIEAPAEAHQEPDDNNALGD
jgi:hypothetical protein